MPARAGGGKKRKEITVYNWARKKKYIVSCGTRKKGAKAAVMRSRAIGEGGGMTGRSSSHRDQGEGRKSLRSIRLDTVEKEGGQFPVFCHQEDTDECPHRIA